MGEKMKNSGDEGMVWLRECVSKPHSSAYRTLIPTRGEGDVAALSSVLKPWWWQHWPLLLAVGIIFFNYTSVIGILNLTTIWTILVSLSLYGVVAGWPFVIGLSLLICVHGLGHHLAAIGLGKAGGGDEKPGEALWEAKVASGGVLVGVGASFLIYLGGWMEGSRLLLLLAQASFLLNFLDLFPAYPLDGGRMAKVLPIWSWLIGIPLTWGSLALWHSPMVVIVTLLCLLQLGWAWKERDSRKFFLPGERGIRSAAVYFGLLLLAGWGLAISVIPGYFS